jgi:hypothetical protein
VERGLPVPTLIRPVAFQAADEQEGVLRRAQVMIEREAFSLAKHFLDPTLQILDAPERHWLMQAKALIEQSMAQHTAPADLEENERKVKEQIKDLWLRLGENEISGEYLDDECVSGETDKLDTAARCAFLEASFKAFKKLVVRDAKMAKEIEGRLTEGAVSHQTSLDRLALSINENWRRLGHANTLIRTLYQTC